MTRLGECSMEFAIVAMVLSFGLSMIIYPKFIETLEKNNTKQQVSEYALDAFKNKKKTPTFGGLVFVVAPIVVAILLNGIRFDSNLYLLLFVFGSYGLIGFIDDYKIVTEGKNDGLSPRSKMLMQLVLAVIFYIFYRLSGGTNTITIPFVKTPLDLGILYLPFIMFLFSGASNAVNLTDGMDGLAAGTTLIAMIPFIIVTLQKNNSISLGLFAIAGALVAFLYFNKKPAKIFMGDVGSLSLGAMLAATSVLLEMEVMLAVIGGVFVFETLCVIIQRTSWKLRKKRVFKYTPIHYSFTLSGWEEVDVVKFFYAIGLVCMVIGLVLIALI